MARRAQREVSNEVLVRYLQGEMTRSESEETERLVADSRRAQASVDPASRKQKRQSQPA